jgi:glycosyltransferase involved in cell wall biosynthesis
MERPKWEGTFTRYESLSHVEVAKILQTCTAFVLPSQEEGFARVLAEALAVALPIIASHESGATTLVDDGVEGFIVNGRDPQQTADAMIKLATDPELNRRMGEAAYRKGTVRNTWQDYGDRLLAEYERRLANHG